MFRMTLLRGSSAVALAITLAASPALAQQNLPTIDIGGAKPRAAGRGAGRALAPAPAPAPTSTQAGGGGSLTVPSVAEQRRALEQTVGSVAFVDANTPEIQTRYVARPARRAEGCARASSSRRRYGQELRLSMRGSNLTRDYHLRGLELLQDGIPMNYADGGGDIYQIDPHYFRAIEV